MSHSKKKGRSLEETTYFKVKKSEIHFICKLQTFCSIEKLSYIGIKSYNSRKMIFGIKTALSALNINFHAKGKFVNIFPSNLFRCYISFLPLFLHTIFPWSFHHVILFCLWAFRIQFNAFCYCVPNLPTFFMSQLQRQSLKT